MEFRELLGGVKQWKRELELTSERLSEIFDRKKRVGADGVRPLQRGRYKIPERGIRI